MSFIAFLVAATILAITPGPGIAYVVARTVAGGRSEGLASCIGTGLGGMLHVLAAAQWLLATGVARAARARLMTRISGATMIGLGVFLATAKRQA
jgi:threonine/homoserine/homoserine lactone efflux protein